MLKCPINRGHLNKRHISDEHLQKLLVGTMKARQDTVKEAERNRKISEAMLGKHHSEETKEKIRNTAKEHGVGRWNKGREHPQITGNLSPSKRPDVRFKISQKLKGRKLSEEWKQKISEAMTGLNNPNYGKHRSEITKKKISLSHMEGKNPNWKGDMVGYAALHAWVHRHKKKPIYCECCQINKPYDLANISGKYSRDVNDYEWLCRSCHVHKDGRLSNLKRGRFLRQIL